MWIYYRNENIAREITRTQFDLTEVNKKQIRLSIKLFMQNSNNERFKFLI